MAFYFDKKMMDEIEIDQIFKLSVEKHFFFVTNRSFSLFTSRELNFPCVTSTDAKVFGGKNWRSVTEKSHFFSKIYQESR